MPAIVVASIIAASASTAGAVYASKKSSSAAKRAGEQGATANREALAFEQERDRLDREEFARTEAENKTRADALEREERRRYELETQTDAQRYGESTRRAELSDAFAREQFAEQMGFEKQKYGDRQTQMAPYRARGVEALQRLASIANISVRPSTPPGQPAAPMSDLASGAS